MVTGILKDYHFNLNETNNIIMLLKEMLLAELAGCEIAVELNFHNSKKIIKAIKNELLDCLGNSESVKQAVWAKDPWVFNFMVDLVTPVQPLTFSNFCKWLSRPLYVCFQKSFQRVFIGNRETSFTQHTFHRCSSDSVQPQIRSHRRGKGQFIPHFLLLFFFF